MQGQRMIICRVQGSMFIIIIHTATSGPNRRRPGNEATYTALWKHLTYTGLLLHRLGCILGWRRVVLALRWILALGRRILPLGRRILPLGRWILARSWIVLAWRGLCLGWGLVWRRLCSWICWVAKHAV